MRIFKFGGASVRDAERIAKVGEIVLQEHRATEALVVVVSAMGKTTNAMEGVLEAYVKGEDAQKLWQNVCKSHLELAETVFGASLAQSVFGDSFQALSDKLSVPSTRSYDFEYDQIVSWGEILSTKFLAKYLNTLGLNCEWVDAREIILTDNSYREARIKWTETQKAVVKGIPNDAAKVYITQGFIGKSEEGWVTTLAREGSDFTAAILANCLDAESATIWKDVPGVLNGDPRIIEGTQLISKLSYYEAIEMTYYGAQVIHPKTLKPLQNKNIPLFVRSFINHKDAGTAIFGNENSISESLPVIVVKKKQVLVELFTRDHSFVVEENLSNIYRILAEYKIKVNLSQNGATSFSFVIDGELPDRYPQLLIDLAEDFRVQKHAGLTLISIKNPSPAFVEKQIAGREIWLEQKIRRSSQYLVEDKAV